MRSFLSLAKTLNFSRVAKLVHCSQPALSLQIQALENEIGVKLFERDRRKTVLTAAGTAFQREATGGFGHFKQAGPSARQGPEGKRGGGRDRVAPAPRMDIGPTFLRGYRAVDP